MTERLVDARGHRCPVPALRLAKAMKDAPQGTRFALLTTDPMARIDVPHLLGQTGNRLISVEDQEGAICFTVETGAAPPG